jgi:citrate lyase beta subunit
MLRQPVHTVYGGAHLFKADRARRLGDAALRLLDQHLSSAAQLTELFGIDAELTDTVWQRTRTKLEREPVEDFRIDYEDGYGNRSDEEEDGDAEAAAQEVAAGYQKGTLPPYIGIRVKPLSAELSQRSLRTLDRFCATLFELADVELTQRFFVTLPKLTARDQPARLADRLDQIERRHSLPAGSLRFEIMVETPQTLFGADGASNLPLMVAAGAGRVSAAHFGTYDFTASCNITAAHQHMNHPVCDFARAMMQATLSDQVWLSDGSTAVLPVGDQAAVFNAWRLHYQDVRRSLMLGFYQGWDLHPGQLITRYIALYSFFLEAYDAAAARLRNFMEHAAQATLLGSSFDDAATGQGLLNYFLRGINSGAFSDADVSASTGLSLDELRTRSFARILEMRKVGNVRN